MDLLVDCSKHENEEIEIKFRFDVSEVKVSLGPEIPPKKDFEESLLQHYYWITQFSKNRQ